MWRTPKRPIGVVCFGVPTATSYCFTSWPPMRTTRIFFCVETAMLSGAGAGAPARNKRERRRAVMPRLSAKRGSGFSCAATLSKTGDHCAQEIPDPSGEQLCGEGLERFRLGLVDAEHRQEIGEAEGL